jgi:hypothetical protein
MTLSRVGNSVAVGSLHLFAWDTRSQGNDFTASVRDGAGTCVSGEVRRAAETKQGSLLGR